MKHCLSAVLACLFAAVPSAVSACAVCFGGSESNLARGFFWGVLLLLILPFALTAGFITMVMRASDRRKKES
jgi:hypothetical protein